MTDQQIIECYEANNSLSASQKDDLFAIARATDVEKLIAGIRDDLALGAGTDMDKFPDLVLDKVPRAVVRLRQLTQLNQIKDDCVVEDGSVVMVALADMAKTHPDHETKLIDEVAKQVPIINSEVSKFRIAPEPKAR